MGRINRANLKKTIYYLRRNGIMKTWYAVRERAEEKSRPSYAWMPPSEAELEEQRCRWKEKGFSVVFSIIVPAYRTQPAYLKELIMSLRRQTYPKWELILADATEDDSVERVVRSIVDFDDFAGFCESRDSESGAAGDLRIHYIHLDQNAGIAENTNRALPYAVGDYVGLLDHDDVLAENALYEMASAIETGREQGQAPRLLYSDEDKCNGDRTEYYEPNFKEAFNLDLLLSNNYICHFLVMDRELIQKLKFRREFDGAQDYDLVLRAAAELGALQAGRAAKTGSVIHIPKVLYHWRCHTGSTAENPQSKRYAYDAGRRAVQDFAERAGWHAEAVETAHVGFYRLQYEGDLFDSRPDVGAVGGSVIGRRRLTGSYRAGNKPEADIATKENASEAGIARKGNVSEAGNARKESVSEEGDARKESVSEEGNARKESVSEEGNVRKENASEAGSGQKYNALSAKARPGYGMRIIGGRMAEDGSVFYENLPIHYSGYLHRAVLPQDAFAVDIRNIRVRPECRELFRRVTGVSYRTLPGTDIFDASVLPGDCDIRRASLEFGMAMRDAGYRIVYLPTERLCLERMGASGRRGVSL